MRINIFGGPGVGKSTLAARWYSEAKTRGEDVELVQEFVKQLAYTGHRPRGWDYIHTFGCQLKAEHDVLQTGTHIITDSPLFLQCIYADVHGLLQVEHLFGLSREFDKEYHAVNVLLKRVHAYQEIGRFETQDEAIEMDRLIERYLNFFEIPYEVVTCNSPLP